MKKPLKHFITLLSTAFFGNYQVIAAQPSSEANFSQNDSFLGKLNTYTKKADNATKISADPGVFKFAQDYYNANEIAQGEIQIAVERTHCGSGSPPVSVSYETLDGTARAGIDYALVKGTLTWGNRAEGDCEPRRFMVPILDDSIPEGNETIELRLHTPFGGAGVAQGNAVLTIVDDDIVGNDGSVIGFPHSNYVVNEADGIATITVTRQNCSPLQSLPASIFYHTTNASGDNAGSAIVGRDYIGVNGVLSWGSDAATSCGERYFTIPIQDDNLLTTDKTITLSLTSARGALLGQHQATLTILENEASSGPGILNFSQADYQISEAGSVATITVNRDECGPGSPPVSVSYTTYNGSALHPTDYQIANGTLIWEDNGGDCASKQFQVPIIDDALTESNETIKLQLNDPSGGAVVERAQATLTIYDNDKSPSPQPQSPDDPGIFGFSKTYYQVEEGNRTALLVLERTACGHESPPAAITITSHDGTAQAAQDYESINKTLYWGMTEEESFNGDCEPWYVYVSIKEDALFEDTETIQLRLSEPVIIANENADDQVARVVDSSVGNSAFSDTNNTQSSPNQAKLGQSEAVLAIIDNDGSTIEFSAPDYTVIENNPMANVTVTRQGIGCNNNGFPLPPASISYNTSNPKPSTAASGSDYVAMQGTLQWSDTASGESCGARQIEIPIIDDPLIEGDETLLVNLGNPKGANGGGSQITLTIKDDEDNNSMDKY